MEKETTFEGFGGYPERCQVTAEELPIAVATPEPAKGKKDANDMTAEEAK